MKISRLVKLFLTLICLFGILLNSTAFAKSQDQMKKIRVGYVYARNFQEGGNGNTPKRGYGYEYLQKLAANTGWEYTYVYGGREELLHKLEAGEIDLMGNISYTPERATNLLFSDMPMGTERYFVYTLSSNKNLSYRDLSTLNGKRIGVSMYSIQEDILKAWLTRKGINAQVVEYATLIEKKAALMSGTIDAAVTMDMFFEKDYSPVANIGESAYYFVTSKQFPELMQELNRAHADILRDDPFYKQQLSVEYFKKSMGVKSLNQEESDWLARHHEIRVGYMSDYLPFCGTEEKNGEKYPSGLLDVVMDSICREYNTAYSGRAYNNPRNMLRDLQDGQIDIIFPVIDDSWIAEKGRYLQSEPVVKTDMVYITKSENIGGVSNTFAVTTKNPFQISYVRLLYPNSQFVYCDDLMDCIDAVINGDAECTVVNNAAFQALYNKIKNASELRCVSMPENIGVSFGVARDNAPLVAILNKGIAFVDKTLISNAMIRFAYEATDVSVLQFLKKHIVPTSLIAIIVLGLMGFLYYRKRVAQRFADVDELTKLYNRRAGEDKIDVMVRTGKGLFLILDLDGFKQVNDKFGHQAGDFVLKVVADRLRSHSRSNDIVMRLGGDEFVMYFDTDLGAKILSTKCNNLLNAINEKIVYDNAVLPIGCSIGACVAGKDGNTFNILYHKADAALYLAKENGKNCYRTTIDVVSWESRKRIEEEAKK